MTTKESDDTTAEQEDAPEQEALIVPVPALTTPCSLNAFRNWLKVLDTLTPGTTGTVTTTATSITAA